MKTGRLRTMSICLTDLLNVPPEKIYTPANGKQYVALVTWDYDENQTNDQDFAIMIERTAEEKAAGQPVIYLGGGIIQKPKQRSNDEPSGN